jgi:type VI secretion system protein ImpB
MADPTPTIKQRVKVSILPSSNAQEDIELDYRILLTGDYSKSEPGKHKDGLRLKERRVRVISNKRGFQDVMEELNPKLTLKNIPNKLTGGEDDMLEPVELEFKSMKDFHPDQIAQKVEPLRKLLEARERLKQFKMDVVRWSSPRVAPTDGSRRNSANWPAFPEDG